VAVVGVFKAEKRTDACEMGSKRETAMGVRAPATTLRELYQSAIPFILRPMKHFEFRDKTALPVSSSFELLAEANLNRPMSITLLPHHVGGEETASHAGLAPQPGASLPSQH
jgi:hypothetical protein